MSSARYNLLPTADVSDESQFNKIYASKYASVPVPEMVHDTYEVVHTFWSDFRAFMSKSPALDLGVGLILGSMFTSVVNSLMVDIISPPVGLMLGSNLKNLFIVLKPGASNATSYPTLEKALDDGAVTENYGLFLHNVVNFFIVAFIIYWIITFLQSFKRDVEEELGGILDKAKRLRTGQCPTCDETVSVKAKRCPHCTSEIDWSFPPILQNLRSDDLNVKINDASSSKSKD